MSDLSSLQESYLAGLRTVKGQRKGAMDNSVRPGLGSRQSQKGREYWADDIKDKFRPSGFPLTTKTMALSLMFWCVLIYLFYQSFGYAFMAVRIMTDEQDLSEEPCRDQFSMDPQENFKRVANYPKGDAGPYLLRLQSVHESTKDLPAKKLRPLVTAVWSSQFYQVQGLVQHITDLRTEHLDVTFIVYDLGLYRREREIIKKYCNCDLRTIDYSAYPDHVADTQNYAWRPIILQELLEEFGAVIFLEPTTRFKTRNSLGRLLSQGENNYLIWDTPSFTSVVTYTNKLTFTFLNESRCAFKEAGLLDSQLLVLYRTNVTWDTIMKPWLKCALNLDCIAPKWSRIDGCLHIRRPKTTGCHRYDISVLSILMNRALRYTTLEKRHVPPRLVYREDEEVEVFLEQPWTNLQLFFLAVIPVFCFVLFKTTILRKTLGLR